MTSISELFIRRPVGTTLLAIGLFLVGIVAYVFLPVSSVPNVDFPMIRVSATRPGADPSVMASTVAAPLERRLGQIAGLDQITSTSSLGTTSIQLQFSLDRSLDGAAGYREHDREGRGHRKRLQQRHDRRELAARREP